MQRPCSGSRREYSVSAVLSPSELPRSGHAARSAQSLFGADLTPLIVDGTQHDSVHNSSNAALAIRRPPSPASSPEGPKRFPRASSGSLQHQHQLQQQRWPPGASPDSLQCLSRPPSPTPVPARTSQSGDAGPVCTPGSCDDERRSSHQHASSSSAGNSLEQPKRLSLSGMPSITPPKASIFAQTSQSSILSTTAVRGRPSRHSSCTPLTPTLLSSMVAPTDTGVRSDPSSPPGLGPCPRSMAEATAAVATSERGCCSTTGTLPKLVADTADLAGFQPSGSTPYEPPSPPRQQIGATRGGAGATSLGVRRAHTLVTPDKASRECIARAAVLNASVVARSHHTSGDSVSDAWSQHSQSSEQQILGPHALREQQLGPDQSCQPRRSDAGGGRRSSSGGRPHTFYEPLLLNPSDSDVGSPSTAASQSGESSASPSPGSTRPVPRPPRPASSGSPMRRPPSGMRALPPIQKHLKASAALRAIHDLEALELAADQKLGPVSRFNSCTSAISLASSGSFDATQAPDKVKIKIHAVTFNMASTRPDRLPTALLSTHREGPADVYIIGSQESCPVGEWERMVHAQLGGKFVKVSSETLMSMHVVLYCRQHLAHYIADVRTSMVATGMGNMIGNKGGVALAFSIANAKVLVVASHLAAHDDQVDRRNADFHRIASGLFTEAATFPLPDRTMSSAPSQRNLDPGNSTSRPVTAVSAPAVSGVAGASNIPNDAPGDSSGQCPSPPERPLQGGVLGMLGQRRGIMDLHQAMPPPSSSAHRSMAQQPSNLSQASSASSTTSAANAAATAAADRSMLRNISSRRRAAAQPSAPSFSGGSFTGGLPAKGAALLDSYDVVLWMGDLNYRINANVDSVLHLVRENLLEVLFANDQLKLQQKKGKAFQGFLEQEICFPPTFKYDQYSHEYSLKRVPSWTDRILYMCNAPTSFVALKPLYYNAVHELTSSDHRPVVAGFELVVQPENYAPPDGIVANKCVIS